MQARITIADIDIRSAVLRRMFAGMREPDAAERREIMARYVAADSFDYEQALGLVSAFHRSTMNERPTPHSAANAERVQV